MLDRYQSSLPSKADDVCEQLADVACETSKTIAPIELGGLRSSIEVAKHGDTYEVVCNAPYCAFVEFGTGIGTPSRETKDRKLMAALGYVVNKSGKGEQGWWYYDKNMDSFRFTHGQSGKGFMAKGALQARRELGNVAKAVFND